MEWIIPALILWLLIVITVVLLTAVTSLIMHRDYWYAALYAALLPVVIGMGVLAASLI